MRAVRAGVSLPKSDGELFCGSALLPTFPSAFFLNISTNTPMARQRLNTGPQLPKALRDQIGGQSKCLPGALRHR